MHPNPPGDPAFQPPRGDIRQDKLAFESFFSTQFPTLCAWCRYRFRFDLQQAKEVVHTAFIKLWQAHESFPSEAAALPYLHKIVLNNSLDAIRHERVKEEHRRHVLASADRMMEELQQFHLKKLQADIDAAVAALPDQMRKVFELSRYEGLKHAEIAQRLNISVNTVETQMGRALKKLRIQLSAYVSYCLILLIINHMTKR